MQSVEPRDCQQCYRRYYGARCRRRTCPGYVKLWLRDQRTVFKAAMARYPGRATMVTITAPGRDRLPWDRTRCTHAPGERCSGNKGCKVDALLAAEWNRTIAKRLRLLNRMARSYARRRFPREQLPQLVAYVTQDQERGVLHVHCALGYTSQGALSAYLDGLRRGLGRHGFGPKMDRGFLAQRPGALGSYMARYLDPAKYGASFLRVLSAVERCERSHQMAGEHRSVLRPVYVSPAAIRRSGRTIEFERFKRQQWRKNGPQALDHVFVDYVNFCGRRERREGWRREEMAVPEIACEPPAGASWVQEDLF